MIVLQSDFMPAVELGNFDTAEAAFRRLIVNPVVARLAAQGLAAGGPVHGVPMCVPAISDPNVTGPLPGNACTGDPNAWAIVERRPDGAYLAMVGCLPYSTDDPDQAAVLADELQHHTGRPCRVIEWERTRAMLAETVGMPPTSLRT